MFDDSSDIATGGLASDPLSEILQDLRLSGVSYGRCNLTQPWGIDFPAQSAARFHFVAEGSCWLRVPEGDWVELQAGEVVLLPRGGVHALADAPNTPTRPLPEMPLEEIGDRVYQMRAGGKRRSHAAFCCRVTFEEPTIHPLRPARLSRRLGRRCAAFAAGDHGGGSCRRARGCSNRADASR